MIDKRVLAGGVLVTCALALVGCTSGDATAGGSTVDGVRKAAVGASPGKCPIPFDVSAALPGSGQVRPGEVDVQVSKTTTPAADPLTAQRDQGMSALDAAAGVSIDCRYEVGDKTLDAWLVATPGRASIDIMAPRIAQAAHLDVTQVTAFLAHQPEPGGVELTPGGDVAVSRLHVDGDGDASLLVVPDDLVSGDALGRAAQTLAGQIRL